MTPELENLNANLSRLRAEVAKVIIGQHAVIDLALITIITGQHALIEGVPGVAKTLLVRALGRAMGCATGRVQFTPDLMPADITGTNVFNLRTHEFTLIKGPVFTGFLLADEINRAPAKTQAALLQAMQERAVTIDRETHALDSDFTVFATQNPIEFEGTYPLPEAQKDRFVMKIPMACPEREDELVLARRMLGREAPEAVLAAGGVQPVLAPGGLAPLRAHLEGVSVREEILAYIVDLVRQTRRHESLLAGAGPRATQALVATARARAALDQRDFVTPDDVRELARPVLEHRLVIRPEFEIEGMTAGEAVQRILEIVPVPR